MELPRTSEFAEAKAKSVSMVAAVKLARAEIRAVSDKPVDSVAKCERAGDGGWLIALDLVESPARMGENDLLSRFVMQMEADGSVVGIEHAGRYRREDGPRP